MAGRTIPEKYLRGMQHHEAVGPFVVRGIRANRPFIFPQPDMVGLVRDTQQRQLGQERQKSGPLEHDAAQRIVERGQWQGLHEGLYLCWKALGREKDPREDPHRHHHQIHDPRDTLNGPRTRGREQTKTAEGQGAEQ